MKQKIYSLDQLAELRQVWKQNKEQVVFTNGCFDLIHRGHLHYLEAAKQLGGKLIVAINSDASVKQLKGPSRPIKPETDRLMTMAAFYFVDAVVLFDQETPADVINTLIPDVLVKGGDYKPEEIVGYDTVTKHGGNVLTLDFVEGHSSSQFIEKMS
ncbi:MAG: D-glycero-beta-D-manno-heptose 1-phosphate adenylyltransferase [Flavobacteriales bacterium]